MGMLKNLVCKVGGLGFSGPNIIPSSRNLTVRPSREALPERELYRVTTVHF
jgi:hypothetical protein